VIAAYALPAVAVWAALAIALTAVRLAEPALAAAVLYGGGYALAEIFRWRAPRPPGRSWQVPQSMLIEASIVRRVLVWGSLLGPGFATRNPYAGFWLLPLAVASMPGMRTGLAVGAAVGLAHGAARGAALLRDVKELQPAPIPAAAVAGAVVPVAPAAVDHDIPTHLDMVLKAVRWRRLDGALLAAAAAAALAAWLGTALLG
jgi:hypothetical protein